MEEVCICGICGKSISRANYSRHLLLHNDLENIAKVDSFITLREPTDDQCEEAAVVCEEFCKLYPVFFPHKNLTRKMTEWSLVLPRFIREKKGMCNRMMRLEQEGEHLHKELNSLERSQKQTLNKAKRYFDILKEYENKLYATKNQNKVDD